jgi:protein Tex
MEITEQLARQFAIKMEYSQNIIALIDEGNTIPFIARYRKEKTGSCDDQVLREFGERLTYLRNLEERKTQVKQSIEEQGKLTDEITANLQNATTLVEVEDIYRPYKQKRRTRATIAKERGLEPLAELLIAQNIKKGSLQDIAAPFIDPEKSVSAWEDAVAGAQDIIAERISDDPALRKKLRVLVQKDSLVDVRAAKEEDSVYKTYYDFKQGLGQLPGHRILAINRGEKEGFLKVGVAVPTETVLQKMRADIVKEGSVTTECVSAAVQDSWNRLLWPSLEREIRNELTEHAQEGAIHTFALNLKPLLLQSPVKNKVTMGFDPAYRTGCKIAVVDQTGKLLDTTVVYPTPPQNKQEEAKAKLKSLIHKHGVSCIAIGNGTASKESEIFVAELTREIPGLSYMVVNEAGASVYSASKLGAKEFPEMDVSLRSAVSIARRLQDPLAELVKIDPKSIGVGQYQHDMPGASLDSALLGVVESCVNTVGVDVNTASVSLLSYISGLNATLAQNIVEYRNQKGAFKSRAQFKEVSRMGPKAFEQSAGFMRIPGGEELLDNTSVHPESYGAVKKLLIQFGYAKAGISAAEVDGLAQKIREAGEEKVAAACGVGLPTLRDILTELKKPGRDVRDELPPPLLRTDVLSMEDLKPGMEIAGTVRNVVDFGVFVDIGVHQDGLVHISEMVDRYIKHPSEVSAVGDIVRVWVLDMDAKKGRISLTMKEKRGESR